MPLPPIQQEEKVRTNIEVPRSVVDIIAAEADRTGYKYFKRYVEALIEQDAAAIVEKNKKEKK